MPPTGDRRKRERFGIIEEFMTITYNAMRRHMPETMDEPCRVTVSIEKPRTMAAAA